jgi:hypothetical protein
VAVEVPDWFTSGIVRLAPVSNATEPAVRSSAPVPLSVPPMVEPAPERVRVFAPIARVVPDAWVSFPA